jgi:hypothetical protein
VVNGLGQFVTKSYDKKPATQGVKVKAVKKAAKKMPAFLEKKTGERYKSKADMKKHEKGESKAVMAREYGKKAAVKKVVGKMSDYITEQE